MAKISLSSAAAILEFGGFLFRKTRYRAVLALTFLLLGSIMEGFSILMLIPLLQLAGPQYRGMGAGFQIPFVSKYIDPNMSLGLVPVLLIFVALMIVQIIFVRFKAIYMAELSIEFINDLRISLFESIGRAQWTKVARMRGSDLNHVLLSDIDRVQNISYNFLMFIQGVVLLTIYLIVALLISKLMTVFAAIVGGGVLISLQPIRNRAAQYGKLLTLRRQNQYRIVAEFLAGLKVAKSFNTEPRYLADLSATIHDLGGEQARWARVNSISSVVFQLASALGLAAFVYLALNKLNMPLAKIIAMILVFMRISPRFTAIQIQLQDMILDLPALSNVQAVQKVCDDSAEDHSEDASATPVPPLGDRIRFCDVTFAYNEAPALSNVSLEIPAHGITALVGPSGGGKSTVADLLMGLLEPSSGTVEIDGSALAGATRRSWRNRVSYVPQDVFLLHDTIAANLLIAAPDATEEMIWTALEMSNARTFVEALPDKLKTVVGDRGARLSGGERQRIALARGLLRQPDLLILDEATSALDGETQEMIARTMNELRRTMTILTIAHRATMVAIADHVIVLEGGRVVEAGGYDMLMRAPGGRLGNLIATDNLASVDP